MWTPPLATEARSTGIFLATVGGGEGREEIYKDFTVKRIYSFWRSRAFLFNTGKKKRGGGGGTFFDIVIWGKFHGGSKELR